MASAAKSLIAVSLLLGFLLPISMDANSATAEWCEQQWSVESAKAVDRDPPDYPGFLTRWQQYGQQCSGTVAYEARLAFAYLFLKQPNKAREVLKPLGKTSSPYRYLVDFALLHADATDITNGVIKREDVIALEQKYAAFVRKYPDFADGYAVLGGLQTALEKHAEAIQSLEAGKQSSMDVSSVYRNLTLSYTAMARYSEALETADKAFRLKNSLKLDQYFVYAFAKASAGTGDLKTAENALRVIATKKPEVRNDPDFKNAVDFVMARSSTQGTK
jgi:tetratricopeptide (TPR) repeat protein